MWKGAQGEALRISEVEPSPTVHYPNEYAHHLHALNDLCIRHVSRQTGMV